MAIQLQVNALPVPLGRWLSKLNLGPGLIQKKEQEEDKAKESIHKVAAGPGSQLDVVYWSGYSVSSDQIDSNVFKTDRDFFSVPFCTIYWP